MGSLDGESSMAPPIIGSTIHKLGNAVESAGEWAKLRCADDIEFGRPRCGEWMQLFMFTLQVQGRLE